jgi:hypothetical protein
MTAHVHVKLMLADSYLAVLPLERDTCEEPASVLVRHRSLIEALEALFERVWEAATPVPSWPDAAGAPPQAAQADASTAGVSGTHLTPRRVICDCCRCWSPACRAGRSPPISASALGRWSRIRKLMDQAGVSTRIQLGLHAGRQGWI